MEGQSAFVNMCSFLSCRPQMRFPVETLCNDAFPSNTERRGEQGKTHTAMQTESLHIKMQPGKVTEQGIEV